MSHVISVVEAEKGNLSDGGQIESRTILSLMGITS